MASVEPPAIRFAILTCMDARLDPAKYARLAEGDAHVIRNAGGRATDDAIRSLVISHKLLGTAEWFVIHHTNCGMELFSDEVIADLLDEDLGTASYDGKTWSNAHRHGGHAAGHFIKWHTIKDQEDSVALDVRRIREHPLVPKSIPIHGYIYDVRTGRLNEVKPASAAGKSGGLDGSRHSGSGRGRDGTQHRHRGPHSDRRSGGRPGVPPCRKGFHHVRLGGAPRRRGVAGSRRIQALRSTQALTAVLMLRESAITAGASCEPRQNCLVGRPTRPQART